MATATPVHAHTGPPRSVGVVVAQGDADHVLVRTTYGMVRTRDGGTTFEWLCGEAAGFDADIELPPAVIFADGSMTVGTFGGPTHSLDGGCNWQPTTGVGGDKFFRQILRDGGGVGALSLAADALGGDVFDVALYQTSDGGGEWSRLGVSPPDDFFAFNALVAPSDSSRIYLAGHDGPAWAQKQVVMRSDDRGQSWQRLELPHDALDSVTTIAGIDPLDPDIFYLGTATHALDSTFTVYRSTDGATFEELVVWPQESASLALSPDGSTLAIGNYSMGLWTASVASSVAAVEFAEAAGISVGCLSWDESGLFACGDEAVDGFSLGLSQDGGASFIPFMVASSPCAPLTCDEQSSVGLSCPARWEIEYQELEADNCSSYNVGGAATVPDDPDGSGTCTATAAAPAKGESAWMMLLMALAAAFVRRRR